MKARPAPWKGSRESHLAFVVVACALVLASAIGWTGGCAKKPVGDSAPPPATAPASSIQVSSGLNSISIETKTAEFTIAQDGYVAAKLLHGTQRLSLDDPGNDSGASVVAAGKEVKDFVFDLGHAQTSAPEGKLGSRGKRIVIQGKSPLTGLELALAIEVHDEFPNIALLSSSIRNAGATGVSLDQVDIDRHRLNATLVDPKSAPNQIWSFHGASIRWGKDNVFEIPRNFEQQNQMGSMVEVKGDLGRVGGGIPVVAFWTRQVGEAIGHVETLPLVLSVPVKTESDGRVDASVRMLPNLVLQPGDVYATPRTFVAVYSGDYYEPLRMYSDVIDREGLTKATSTNE